MSMYWKIILLLGIILIGIHPNSYAFAEAPYYTYTSDGQGTIIKTQTGYTPANQISVINGERLGMPEHVFVDKEDYIYITDSSHNKVYILDRHYRYYNELTSDKFSTVQSSFVTDDYIYVVDSSQKKIFIFDKSTHEFVREIGQPDTPIFNEGYGFSPTHIAVDVRGNIYVRSSGSVNGLIMLNREGEFITFFGANPLNVPLLDQVRSFFLTEAQQRKLERVFPDVPSNITIDERGFIYTVTSSIETNPVKKFNVSGTNYFPDDLVANHNMESVWLGKHNNVYSITSDGWIYEYDSEGDLLFLFGGSDVNSSRYGLLNRPVSIASNSADDLIVIDQGTSRIQTYRSTQFADAVHNAMGAYQEGDYTRSKELWEYTMTYNSIFDNAHIGLGDAFLREGDPHKAYEEFYDAKHTKGISEAFWEIRRSWLENNLKNVFLIIVFLVILGSTHKFLNRKYDYGPRVLKRISVLRRIKILDDLLYMFSFMKQPLNGIYEIQDQNRVARRSSSIIYSLIAVIFIMHHMYTNVLFVPKNQYIVYELSILMFLFVLWLVSNYLICSINDGEGSFKHVYNGTAYALSPILIIMPLLILFSNGLTLEQSVFYHLPIQGMFIWVVFLLFFMIKDIHNYDVGETIGVISKSMFTMLIIGLFLFVLYSLGNQMIDFLYDVVTEVDKRW
ncbi:YIP1 family protein [Bacillus solitudinis]|uniref:YIP1 family protein n=1 Tax=Bacillus solitudinis TaxID=2014074 RepID=UPI000C238F54|nr:YIP1 family protein [Bacillus solitudinis]